ncbi:uncharacterized protein CCOS01_16401 [Colletotrichum costaricense]|uniref:Uncharacterized protein n=1 Tax=Colletotrichum costaricense TaxID=1209916 RepID=A0AAJ0DSK5_9PEZI|nr:uncharacterized protein CCOS01_16401 [Colletotrichum costaricense]KAK1506542.1 hypothetical protein CCOS01_16401 [Colletotrichum costaricense]
MSRKYGTTTGCARSWEAPWLVSSSGDERHHELKPDDGPLHDVEDEHRVSDEHEFQYTRIIMNVLRLNNAASVGKTVRSLTASGPSEILDAYGMIDILVNDKPISWVGSTGISVVHAGSIMDSSKVVVDSTAFHWVLGARKCISYYVEMGLTRLIGEKIFLHDTEHPDSVDKLEADMFMTTFS